MSASQIGATGWGSAGRRTEGLLEPFQRLWLACWPTRREANEVIQRADGRKCPTVHCCVASEAHPPIPLHSLFQGGRQPSGSGVFPEQ